MMAKESSLMRKPAFWILVAVLLTGLIYLRERHPGPGRADEIQAGLEIVTLPAGSIPDQARVVAVRIDPARWTLRVVDRHQGQADAGATADEVCPSPGAAINASFFDENRAPLGLLIIDGKQRRPRHPVSGWPGGGGLFVVRKGKPSILAHTAKVPAGAEYAMQCWPRLVIAGEIPEFKQRPSALRSAVGIDKAGRVLFVASTRYYTFEQWAALLRDQLGCVDALNMDGGPSTQLAVRGKKDIDVPGGWPVPVLLTAERKKK